MMTLPGSTIAIGEHSAGLGRSRRRWVEMHALFLVCLVGGLGVTVLLALFGGLVGHIGGHGVGELPGGHSAAHLGAPHAHAALPAAQGHLAVHAPGGHGMAIDGAHAHPGITGQGHAGSLGPATSAGAGSVLLAAFGWTLSWLSPLSIAAAALWFGAGGLLAELVVPGGSVVIAAIAAVLGAGIVRAFMSAFARASSEPLSAVAVGAIGVLNARIQPGSMGEVVYDLEGLHRSAPARSVDGTSMPRGASVVIVRHEQGVAYVSALDPLNAIGEPEPTGSGVEERGSRRIGP
jgi:hypothetical protein